LTPKQTASNMPDFIIIGGGLIGMLTARELVNAGHRVTLLEQGATGRESSWAGGGIISPLHPWRYADSVTRLAAWGQQQYPSLAHSLQQESGIDPEYCRNGLLVLEPEEPDTALRWCNKHGQPGLPYDTQEIIACEPSLLDPPESALWMPEVAQVRNPRLAKACYGAIAHRVEIHQQTEVTRLLTAQGRITGIQAAGDRRISAPNVIVCAGAWSGKLLQTARPTPSIEPVLGQMILYRSSPDAIRRIVLHRDRYVIPRRDGRILVGSTLEYRGFQKQTTQAARDELSAYALEHFPILREAQIEHHWAGLRPGSPQGIPYIGPVPGVEGLYINAGHFRNGVVLGPASARLMADLVLGREPIVPPAPYAVTAARNGK
jgi:glycine oxidase